MYGLFFGFVPDNKLYDHTDYHDRQKQQNVFSFFILLTS